jgi:hypothetical protein
MDKTKYTLVVDEITMGDMLVFEKATGSRLLDAISPRSIKDEDTGKPIMAPDENGDQRPLKLVNMTTTEMVGAILIAKRQADRPNEDQLTELKHVLGLRLVDISISIDWGKDDVSDGVDPTEPAAADTEKSS